jgi:AcrR family transcriptional regulator
MARSVIAVAAERIAEGKRLYELTSTPVREIAAMMGLSQSTLRRRVRDWSWVPRYAPRLVTMRGEVSIPPDDVAGTGSVFAVQPLTREERVALAAYFHRTVERGLGQVNRILDKNGPADEAGAERAARVLVSIFRTLREMTAVMPPEEATSQDEADDEPAPRTLDEFREALAEQIERILQAHRSRSGGSPGGIACGDDRADQTE